MLLMLVMIEIPAGPVIYDGPSQGDPGTGIAIGQSDCVLLGKYITNNDDGVLMYKNVVGYIDDNLSLASTDVESLKDLQISHFTNIH